MEGSRREKSVARHLDQSAASARPGPPEALAARIARLTAKIGKLREEMRHLMVPETRMLAVQRRLGETSRAMRQRRDTAAPTSGWR